MSLPAAAKKQIEDAAKLHAEIYGTNDKPGKDEKSPAPLETLQLAKEETPPEEAPKGLEVTANDSSSDPAPAPTPPAEVKPDFEQQYRTLQGKYNAELPRLQGKIESLETVIAQMQVAPPPAAPAAQAPAPETSTHEEDVEEYGAEFVQMVQRVAAAESESRTRELRAENEQLRAQMSGVVQGVKKTAEESMHEVLDTKVPNWRAVNKSDDFMTWLQDRDPYSGQKRHDMLLKAYEDSDATRTVAFFQGFINENAAVASETPATRQPAKVSLETLVAPGKAVSAEPVRAQDEPSKRIYTPAEVKQFYDDVAAKKYVGKEKLRVKTERAIFSAGSEGRIR